MLTFAEVMLEEERAIERVLAGAALIYPREIAALEVRPEVDQMSVAFFRRFDKRKAELLAASDDAEPRCQLFAWRCGGRDAFDLYAATVGENVYLLLPVLADELLSFRAARKATAWVERTPHVMRVLNQIRRDEALPYA